MMTRTKKAEGYRRGKLALITWVYCCGDWLPCPDFTNTCDCGADFNWHGARLADRSQWGEETGEVFR